jgi:uncharacterized membrane protein
MVYVVTSIACGLVLPRIEHGLFGAYAAGVSVSAALAFLSAVSSGMLALIGIVFAIAFVVVQFSTVAYSPRLAVIFGDDPLSFHTLGLFFATFTYSLATLLWTDRDGSGQVPLLSGILVGVLLFLSMLAFARLVQSLSSLQIHNVLRHIGGRGRTVIRAMFPDLADETAGAGAPEPPAPETATQFLTYEGEPRVICSIDIPALVRAAERHGAVIVLECGVGETLVDTMALMRVHGAAGALPERELRAALRLGSVRTFEQDPKYAIRLLVDIAIRALSPAVNDPTTAVQALDQIEDLLRRLGRRRLDAGFACDTAGRVRLIFPVAGWEDYLALAFDEIRQFGVTSVQVLRRLRSVLTGLAESAATEERRAAVRLYIRGLEEDVTDSDLDERDRGMALQEDRQGLGMPRRPGFAASRPAPRPPAA